MKASVLEVQIGARQYLHEAEARRTLNSACLLTSRGNGGDATARSSNTITVGDCNSSSACWVHMAAQRSERSGGALTSSCSTPPLTRILALWPTWRYPLRMGTLSRLTSTSSVSRVRPFASGRLHRAEAGVTQAMRSDTNLQAVDVPTRSQHGPRLKMCCPQKSASSCRFGKQPATATSCRCCGEDCARQIGYLLTNRAAFQSGASSAQKRATYHCSRSSNRLASTSASVSVATAHTTPCRPASMQLHMHACGR